MGCGRDRHRADFVVIAVAETHDGKLLRHPDMQFLEFADQLAGSFVVEADHCGTVGQLGLDKGEQKPVIDRFCMAAALRRIVPEKTPVIEGKLMIPQGAKTAKIAVVAAEVIAWKNPADFCVAAVEQVAGQQIAALVIIGADTGDLRKAAVTVAQKKNRCTKLQQFFVKVLIGRWKGGADTFGQNSPYRIGQKTFQNLAFLTCPVLGGEQLSMIAGTCEQGLGIPEKGVCMVAYGGGQNGNVSGGGGIGQSIPGDIGAASLPFFDEAFFQKQG